MRYLALIFLAIGLHAVEHNSAADVILDTYGDQIASWEDSTVAVPTYRLRYVYLNLHSSAEAADDAVIGPGSSYALDFNQRILDDLQDWQNSAVPSVVLGDIVPRLQRNVQAIATQVLVFGE